jgi:nucleotide-binding universal stress UspA family protein
MGLYKEITNMPVIGDKPKMDLKSVIYATDFSLYSENAGAYASRIADYFSASLLVVHAFTLSQAAMEVEADKLQSSAQRADLQTLLSRKASLLTTHSVEASSRLLEGDPKEVIPLLADLLAPSVIVLGTHGGGRLEHGIIGSVAERILRSTNWPALTVGPLVRPASSDTFPFRRILLATDFSPAAACAATFAVFLAETLRASIDVLNVIHGDDIVHADRLSELNSQFFNSLHGLGPQQAREFCDPRTYLAIGVAHDQILQHISERSIDLLVLGIRKTSHLSMETRTSGAFRLIADAQCPVLTIRR